jgi:hypothetical protein
LHLEAFIGQGVEKLMNLFVPYDPRDESSVLVIAGDLCSTPDFSASFIKRLADRFLSVVYVLGNHEMYRFDHTVVADTLFKNLNGVSNVFFNASIDSVCFKNVNGIDFAIGTLWGDGGFTLADHGRVGYYMNDFRLIRVNDERFTVDRMIALFKLQRAALELICESFTKSPIVVVTHHLPSRRLVSARFWPGDGSDGANGGFVGDCENLLARTEIAPKLWIHGHTHDTIDTELWDTRVVCRPIGYRGEWASQFNSSMALDHENKPHVEPFFIDAAPYVGN